MKYVTALASRPTQLLKWRTEGKLYNYSALLNSRIFTYLGHLIAEVWAIITVFSSHVYTLYCCWLRTGFYIDDQVNKLKFMKIRW
jgi:hypothetical protein